MAAKRKIGLLVGSIGDGRMADRVLQFVQKRVAKGNDVVVFDADKIDFPRRPQSMNFMFDPASVPKNIKTLNDEIKGMDGFVIISPEYNWSVPPALSSLLDNIPPSTWCWKPCAFVHYSVGPAAGWRVGMQLRNITGALGLMAVPKQMGIPLVQHALKTDGTACDDDKKGDKLTDELDKTLGHLYWCVDAFKSHLKEGKGAPDWSM